MTVSQLITKLGAYDGTLSVIMGGDNDDVLSAELVSTVDHNHAPVQSVRLSYGIAVPPIPPGQ